MSVEERLASLEGSINTWKEEHDKHSNTALGEIKDNTKEIFNRLNTLACGEEKQKIENIADKLTTHLNHHWGVGLLMLSIILGLLVNLMFFNKGV